MINGQVNLRDAVRRKIDFEQGGKQYKLNEKPAVLIVRYVLSLVPQARLMSNAIGAGRVAGTWMNLG